MDNLHLKFYNWRKLHSPHCTFCIAPSQDPCHLPEFTNVIINNIKHDMTNSSHVAYVIRMLTKLKHMKYLLNNVFPEALWLLKVQN